MHGEQITTWGGGRAESWSLWVRSSSTSTLVGTKVESRTPPRLLLLSLPSRPLPGFHRHATMCRRFSLFSLLVRLLFCIFCSQPSRLTLTLTEHITASTFIPLLCETKLIYQVINVISCYEYDLLSYLILTLITVLISLINITYLLFSLINITCYFLLLTLFTVFFHVINIVHSVIFCY